LSGVTNKGWGPSESETLEAFSGFDLLESISDTLVETWGSLHSALDDIEWADNGVGNTA